MFFPAAFSRGAAAIGPGSNAGRAPLGDWPQSAAHFDWHGDVRPRHTHDTVIYEMHVRGFTEARRTPACRADRRGTFAGVVDKIPYLQELGVTVVELMPVHQFDPAGAATTGAT